eukprot:833024_1
MMALIYLFMCIQIPTITIIGAIQSLAILQLENLLHHHFLVSSFHFVIMSGCSRAITPNLKQYLENYSLNDYIKVLEKLNMATTTFMRSLPTDEDQDFVSLIMNADNADHDQTIGVDRVDRIKFRTMLNVIRASKPSKRYKSQQIDLTDDSEPTTHNTSDINPKKYSKPCPPSQNDHETAYYRVMNAKCGTKAVYKANDRVIFFFPELFPKYVDAPGIIKCGARAKDHYIVTHQPTQTDYTVPWGLILKDPSSEHKTNDSNDEENQEIETNLPFTLPKALSIPERDSLFDMSAYIDISTSDPLTIDVDSFPTSISSSFNDTVFISNHHNHNHNNSIDSSLRDADNSDNNASGPPPLE